MAAASTTVRTVAHPSALTATWLWRSCPRGPGLRVTHHHRKMTNVTPAAITGQIHHVVAVSAAAHCCVRECGATVTV